MPMDRFLIAPYENNSGLNTSLKPWQIPDNAWARMDNAYVFRGRVRKRFGSRYMGSNSATTSIDPLTSRLRVQVGTIGAPSSPVPGNVFAVGQMFSAGTQTFIVKNTGVAQAMLATGPGTGTFSTVDGTFALSGTGLSGGTPIYFYPALPVQGLTQYEFTSINQYISFGFDKQFAYTYNNGWSRSGTVLWHAPDNFFFWAYNYTGVNQALTALTNALFVSNFYATNPTGTGTINDDPVYYYDGTNWIAYKAYLNPGSGNAPETGPFVLTSLLIVSFHGRLIYLNTIENDGTGDGITTFGNNIQYINRARWTKEGSPFATDAWYPSGAADNAGNIGITANFSDAPTAQQIIGCGFLKDRLEVYFEESSWELVFTGNEKNAFQWQQINAELGSMATNSTIQFDKALLAIGETGVHNNNGINVIRIDDKIPDQIFQVSNPSTQVERICGIRDYYSEMVYWSMPVAQQLAAQYFPTRILVYNYQNETWSWNDDCITAFGYYDGQQGQSWQDLKGTWATWNSTWNSGSPEQNVRQVIGGNQHGFTFILDDESPTNAAVLQVGSMTQTDNGIQMTIVNHMLQTGDFIQLYGSSTGVVLKGSGIYIVQYLDANTIVASYPEKYVNYTNPPTYPTFTGSYTGGAYAARVSVYQMYSKQWNPYDKDGSNLAVSKIEFNVTKTAYGQVTVNYGSSSAPLELVDDGAASSALMGTSVLDTSPYTAYYPLEASQERLWHPVYLQSYGECIQINITMSPLQICLGAASEDFEVHAIILSTQRSGRLQ